MKSKTTTPLHISTIEYFASQFKKNWDLTKNEVQKVIDLYNVTGLPALNSADLHGLFNDTENLLYDKLTGNEKAHLTIGTGTDRGHLAIDRTKAMEMLIKPNGYNELLQGITAAIKVLKNPFAPGAAFDVRINPEQIKDCFVIDENGALQFTDNVSNEIEEAGKIYVKTEKGQAVYSFLQKVTDAYFECGLDKFKGVPSVRTLPGEMISKIIEGGIQSIDLDNKTFKPVVVNSISINPVLPFDNDRNNL